MVRPRIAWLLVGLALLGGCGRSTYRVTGTVTYAGQPVEEGIILLIPQDGAQGAREAKIVGGRFELQMPPGKVRVEIRGTRRTGVGPMGPVYEDYIPRRYSSQSTLTEEVVPGGPNEWAFRLEPDRP